MLVCYSATPHLTLKTPFLLIKLFGLVYGIQCCVWGSTLDATIELLCAAVRGIIQRKDLFVLELIVKDEQVSRLGKFEEIAKSKCAVTRTNRDMDRWIFVDNGDDDWGPKLETFTDTVLELKPHCECP